MPAAARARSTSRRRCCSALPRTAARESEVQHEVPGTGGDGLGHVRERAPRLSGQPDDDPGTRCHPGRGGVTASFLEELLRRAVLEVLREVGVSVGVDPETPPADGPAPMPTPAGWSAHAVPPRPAPQPVIRPRPRRADPLLRGTARRASAGGAGR